MRSMLARIVLALASVPALGDTSDAQVLVLESPMTEQTYEMERRLTREVERYLTVPLLDRGSAAETLVVNVQIGPDGTVHVVNAHGGSDAQRKRWLSRLQDVRLG